MSLMLMEMAFSKIKDINYDTLYMEKIYGSESVYHDIYDRVVSNTRHKIKSYIKTKNTKLILRCIYLYKTVGMVELNNQILGNLFHYKGSIYRLATVYAVSTFIDSTTINEILLDIMDMTDVLLGYNDPHRDLVHDKLKIIADCRDNSEPVDLMLIIDAYMAFGYSLYPYVITI